MKIIETLTPQEKISMLNGEVVGVFNSLFLPDDKFYSLLPDLCVGYYMQHSGDKTISPTYYKLLELKDEFNTTPEKQLARIIRSKFIGKWDKIYTALTNEYDPLFNYEQTYHRDHNSNDIIKYGSQVENNGKQNQEVTTTTDADNEFNTFGFNSASPVGASQNNNLVKETISADETKNTTSNTSSKTGNDDRDYNSTENITKKGRNAIVSTLVQKELDLRKREIFFDIIYQDIDSITALAIYL